MIFAISGKHLCSCSGRKVRTVAPANQQLGWYALWVRTFLKCVGVALGGAMDMALGGAMDVAWWDVIGYHTIYP